MKPIDEKRCADCRNWFEIKEFGDYSYNGTGDMRTYNTCINCRLQAIESKKENKRLHLASGINLHAKGWQIIGAASREDIISESITKKHFFI